MTEQTSSKQGDGENLLIRRVVSYTPIAMSLIALALVVESIAEFGVNPANYPKDEGWQAHLWQLLMVLEVPIILIFVATSWRSFARNLPIVTLQMMLWVANLLAVHFLKL